MATFLKNLFAPKWQHADSNVRLQALDQLNDTQAIQTLAKQDSSEAVRLKAIGLITDLDYLPKLFNDKSSNIKQAAIAQYIQTLLKTADPEDQIQAISNVNDAQQLMIIATFSTQAQLSQAAINQIKDEPTLFDFIMHSASAKSRLLAAQYIQSKDKLKAIEQHFLNKDKTLVRHAKEKLAALAEKTAKEEETQAKLQQLIHSAQQLTQQAFSPTYAGQITLLKQTWQDCQPSPDQRTMFESAIKQCEQILNENKQQQAEIDAAKSAQRKATDMQVNCIDELQALYAQCKSAVPSIDSLKHSVETIQSQWKEALALSSKVDKTIKKEYEELLKPLFNLQTSLDFINDSSIDLEPIKNALQNHSLNELKQHENHINSIIKTINWPSDFPENSIQKSLLTLKNEINNTLSTLQKSEKKVINQVERSINDFENALSEGHLKNAKNLQTSIRKQLDQIDVKKTKSLHAKFQLLSQSFNDLKDWQGFATLPKFEKLCEEMTSLIEADIKPKEKADAIKSLQDQWKALGSLPDKKQQQALWQQFKQAADKAYEPCQAYFAEMAQVRIYNLEQRTIICEQLEEYFKANDWENANWKSVQQILDKAHDEFKKFSPVNHADKKAIMQRFHDATHNIHDKLVEHFKFNAAQKQALIDEVKALHDAEDIAQAIEECKALQNQWKEKGNAGRAERQLWSDFRQQCDILFEKRNSANQARKQYFDNNINKANSLLDDAKQLVESASKDVSLQLNEITQALSDLELPAKVKHATSKTLADIKQRLNQKTKQLKRQAQQALWLNAQQLAQNLGQAEQSGNMDNDQLAQNLEATQLPAQVKAILQTRLNSNQTDNGDTLERLCLELEILLEVDSPATEQTARMALQVERLQKNMGQNLPSLDEQLEDLQCRWFAVSAKNADYDALHARFFGTLNQHLEQAE